MLLACPPISLLFACFVHVLVLAPQLLHAFGLPTHLLALSMLSACNGLSSAAVACFLPVLVLYLELLHATRKVGLLFATYKL